MIWEIEKVYKVLCILSPSTGCAGTKQKNIISIVIVIISLQSHHPCTRALKFSCSIDHPHYINSSIFSKALLDTFEAFNKISLHEFPKKSIYMKYKLPRVCVGICLVEKHVSRFFCHLISNMVLWYIFSSLLLRNSSIYPHVTEAGGPSKPIYRYVYLE